MLELYIRLKEGDPGRNCSDFWALLVASEHKIDLGSCMNLLRPVGGQCGTSISPVAGTKSGIPAPKVLDDRFYAR